MSEKDFRSIGEVLALLLEEFPDVTISKIRFLESQGLIQPERTPSGYRKFTDAEVERLRYILREQRQNYLPLRIIRTRLDDETGDVGDSTSDTSRDIDLSGSLPGDFTTGSHPAGRGRVPRPPTGGTPRSGASPGDPTTRIARREAMERRDETTSVARDELLSAPDIDATLLGDLEKAGLVTGRQVGDTTFYDSHSVDVARTAARFAALGIDVRHLKAWKSSSDRELSLFEQRILPLLRQRNPAAREEAMSMLAEFIELGSELRSALLMREVSRLTEQG